MVGDSVGLTPGQLTEGLERTAVGLPARPVAPQKRGQVGLEAPVVVSVGLGLVFHGLSPGRYGSAPPAHPGDRGGGEDRGPNRQHQNHQQVGPHGQLLIA